MFGKFLDHCPHPHEGSELGRGHVTGNLASQGHL
jgi:hypothetical protein